MTATLAAVAAPETLREAWLDVLARDREDGVLAAGVARFAADAEANLAELVQRLSDGGYRPGLLTRVTLPKDDGGSRVLHVPPVRDRVVERAVLAVLTPVIDPLLSASAYAYRPGLGVADAVQALARLRAEGLPWVARADVADCFPTIPVPRLRRRIAELVGDEPLLDLVNGLLSRRSTGDGGLRPVAGLPQGSPLSPMWANLVLTVLDERLADAGFPAVRYADDLAVAAGTSQEAEEAMRVAVDAVGELGMGLAEDKSAVMSFTEGFTFLGEDFGPRYPPVLDDHRAVDPPRKVLYAGVQGSRVRIEAGRVVVESAQDAELLDVPAGHLERLVCFGAVGVSAGFRSWAFTNRVEMVFLSRRGTYLGQAAAGGDRTLLPRLRAQLASADTPAKALEFGRAVVAAKLRKQLVLLRRHGRRETAETVSAATGQLERLLTMLGAAGSRDELMGLEGAAARAYFAALGELMPEGLRFQGRSRRPPGDVVNAALSYGYAILAGEAVSALSAAGLDPAIGLLHADHDRRPSLALDLMEEFRPLVVDQVVVAAARRSSLTPDHGRREEGVEGVLLSRAGREVIIDGYEKRMLTMTRGALPGFSGSLRRHLYRQAERVAAFVHDADPSWSGLSWR